MTPEGAEPEAAVETPLNVRRAPDARRRSALGRTLSRAAYLLVLGGVLVGLAVVAVGHFKRGTVLIAVSVFAGALARLLLPESRVGMLAVRRRWIDVTLMTSTAVSIMIVTFVAKGTLH